MQNLQFCNTGNGIAGGGFATKSRRSYCPRKADGFAAAFSGIANNGVVCNRGQYTKEPTHADLEAWKQIWTQYKDQLQPNRKSGMELLHYLQKKFVLTERFEEYVIKAISDNVMMNSHSAEKIPAGEKPIPRAFFLENAGAGTYLYQPENQDAPDLWNGKISRIFVGVELTTGEFMVEGSTLLWDELYAFRGLDEQDLQNYVCVALYINCCNRIRQWKGKK